MLKTATIRENQPASPARAPGYAPVWAVPLARAGLVLADAVWAAVAFGLAFWLRQGQPLLEGAGWSQQFAPYGALLWFLVPVRVLTASYYELYRLRGEFALFEDAVKVFKAVGLGSLLIVAAAFWYRGGVEFRSFSYSRGVFALDFALAWGGLAAVRWVARGVQFYLRRHGVNLIPTFVVGRGPEAEQCIEEMRARPSLGYRVVGVVESTDWHAGSPQEFAGVPLVGDINSLPEAIRAAGVNEVIITDARLSGDTLFDVMMRVGRRRGVEFRIAPNLFNLVPRKTEIDQIGALPMIRLFREPLSDAARLVKRASDLLIAGAALVVLAPVWLVIAVLVKLDSPGPVFYRQERVGMDGRVFLFIKFRSMRADSDDKIHREYQEKLIAGRTAETNLGDSQKPVFKLANDPRITRTGRILRRLSLDEMPQLLNVLRGDMSVVGPRPPIPYEVENYELWHRKRLDMKPGITGLWQVSGRNRLSFDEMVRLDLFYIENWSLWLDAKIILKTLPVMLKGEDAY